MIGGAMSRRRARALVPLVPSLVPAALAAPLLALVLRGLASGWLAPLAAALLIAAVRRAETRAGAFHAAALAALGPTSVAVVAVAPLAPLASVAAAVALALPFGLAGLARHALAKRNPRRADVALLVLWPAVEALLGQPAVFGPWAMPVVSLAYALIDTPLLPLASSVGMHGLSFLVLALGRVLLHATRRPLAGGAGAATLALAGVAAASALAPSGSPTRALAVRIVQPALGPQQIAAARLDPVLADEHARALAASSRVRGRLVVWPEGMLPAPIGLPLRSGRPAALPGDAPVLFGAATRRENGTYNSALIWRPDRLDLVVDKRRLVPFTESSLSRGSWRPPLDWGEERLGVLICWEAAFPALARRAAAEGATVLVVLADDAYASAGPVAELHLRVARLRAAETGLPLVFASQAGPSAVIDGAGRVLERLEQGRTGVLDADVPTALADRPRPLRAAARPADADATPSGRSERRARRTRSGPSSEGGEAPTPRPM